MAIESTSPKYSKIAQCLHKYLSLVAKPFHSSQGIPRRMRFSPDGTKLRFTVDAPEKYTDELWEIKADGTNPHPLLPGWNNPPFEDIGRWSTDGKYFFFQSTREGLTNLFLLDE